MVVSQTQHKLSLISAVQDTATKIIGPIIEKAYIDSIDQGHRPRIRKILASTDRTIWSCPPSLIDTSAKTKENVDVDHYVDQALFIQVVFNQSRTDCK